MKEFFANQPLPRGLYAVKIAKYKEDKLVNDSGVYYVRIENRQVVKLLQKLEQEPLGLGRSNDIFTKKRRFVSLSNILAGVNIQKFECG